ncbi:hypothetical protein E5161_07995 [Cohnella pontilimi]|uniref:Copper amine oxidase-like N-terminal domain-containing protein n=1 Tax=Cohnella pontilimi TaxID=2564100 RepID=A0A4U0FEM4_9BACL|nr:stalk domain-containing protein [Cohnella pontilimi]TJY42774.1 hypothetical protein E5161_07995 [Cohnella pontilimi]
MKRKKARSLCALVVGIALLLSGISSALGASAAPPHPYRIVALGDSLTYGYEPGQTEKSVPYGYADRLYEQALFHGRAKLDNYGILGLRTEGLSKLLQGAADGIPLTSADLQDFSMVEDARVTKQADSVAARTVELKASLSEADLVVMTIGGNDFGDFLKKVLQLSNEDALNALEDELSAIMNKYTENVEKAIRQTSSLAPHARILLTDQYLPLPKLFKRELYDALFEKAVNPLTSAVDGLAAKLRGEGIQVESVHIAEAFKGQEGLMTYMNLGITGGNSKPDIHPRQPGYEAIAKAFSAAVWKEYRQPAPRKTDVPVSLVIGGKELISANKPAMKNNITYAALGDLLKAVGTKYQWTAKTKTAVFQKGSYKVSVTVGVKSATVNGKKVTLSAAPYLQKVGKEQQVYVPVELMAKALQYNIVYRSTIQTVFINP